EEVAESTDTGSASGGTVEFWNDKLSNIEQDQLDAILGSIETASGNPVEMVPYPDTAAYQTAMQQTIKDSKAPGLFTWWSGPQLQTLAENGLIEDLTDVWNETIFDAGISQGIADAFTFDGKIYAAPWSVLYNTILYNKNVFDEYGLEEPETFDEFLEVCETLKSNGVTPIALKSDSWGGFIWFQNMLAAKDVELYNGICDGSIPYTDSRVVEVMKIWEDMLQKGYFSAPMDYSTDVRKSVAQGTVAMMLEPHVELTGMKRDFGMEEGKDIDTFVVPTMDGGKRTIFFEASPLCVSATSAQKEDALNVLKGWYTEDVQNTFYEQLGYTNTSKVSVETPVVQEILADTADADNYQLVLRYYENTPDELRDFALDELMKFQLMNSSAEDTLSTIQTKADEVFGK
ncbi:MAG: ABC transporter substrate-binding protein, partial [Oliverpabstia sp.]